MSDYQLDLPNIQTKQEDKTKENGSKDSLKKKVFETLSMLKQNAQGIAQLKESNPEAYKAIMKVVQSLTEVAQQGLIKNIPEFSVEESSEESSEFFEHSHSEPKDKKALSKEEMEGEDAFWEDVASSLEKDE